MEKIKKLDLKRETVKNLRVQTDLKTGTSSIRIYITLAGQSGGYGSRGPAPGSVISSVQGSWS